jgi:hypothetical protein
MAGVFGRFKSVLTVVLRIKGLSRKVQIMVGGGATVLIVVLVLLVILFSGGSSSSKDTVAQKKNLPLTSTTRTPRNHSKTHNSSVATTTTTKEPETQTSEPDGDKILFAAGESRIATLDQLRALGKNATIAQDAQGNVYSIP